MNGEFPSNSELLQATIDGLSAHVAILKPDGKIVAVNRAWRDFSGDNGGRSVDTGLGLNYLEMAAPGGWGEEALSQARGDHVYSIQAARGIDQVARQEEDRFQLTYPCHGPGHKRWFMMTVTRLEIGSTSYLMVAHENVTSLVEKEEEIRKALTGTVGALADLSEIRDPYTAGHQQNVARLAGLLAREMGLTGDTLTGLKLAASIHDIGKIAVPAEILTRPGKLTELEFQLIQQHVTVGRDIVARIAFPWPIAEIIYQHHERLDGGGYPRGLAGDQICLEARIIMVADTLDAMISHRPYRPGLGMDKAMAELAAGRGVRYDAAITDILGRQSVRAEIRKTYFR